MRSHILLSVLPLLVACVTPLGFTSDPVAGGKRVTIPDLRFRITVFGDADVHTAYNGAVEAQTTQLSVGPVSIDLKPVAETLNELVAMIDVNCGPEFVERNERGGEFELLYRCLGYGEKSFSYYRSVLLGDRRVECSGGGSLASAKDAKRACATLEAVDAPARSASSGPH